MGLESITSNFFRLSVNVFRPSFDLQHFRANDFCNVLVKAIHSRFISSENVGIENGALKVMGIQVDV